MITNISKNCMGTVSFDGKFAGMFDLCVVRAHASRRRNRRAGRVLRRIRETRPRDPSTCLERNRVLIVARESKTGNQEAGSGAMQTKTVELPLVPASVIDSQA